MNIRVPKPDDAAAIADVVRHSYDSHHPDETPADMPIYHAEFHAEMIADPSTRWALLEDADGPAGIAMWRPAPGFAHLHLLFVDAAKQGQGYGSLLLQHFHDMARDEAQNLRLYTLHCHADSLRSLRFYRRHGYSQYEAGDEGRYTDLYLWLDEAKRDEAVAPKKQDKHLLFKLTR